jgi:hypothetical protein
VVYYSNPKNVGIISVSSLSDGYTVTIKWHTAYPNNTSNNIAYHIYYSTVEEDVFSEGVKFVSYDGSTQVNMLGFTPGQLYHFAVRAIEYNPLIASPTQLQQVFNGLAVYPESLLASNITATSIIIPLVDSITFPNTGIIKIGGELINYTSNNTSLNTLNLTNANLQRGFLNTNAREHFIDGYDGYNLLNPIVTFWLGNTEEQNDKIYEAQCHFEFAYDQSTTADGYHQVTKDILNTNLSGSDASNVGFNSYDYRGWHRTDPTQLLNGECVGSYIGGEQYCADGYDGVGRVLRGISFQERNNQRQEVLLSVTGEPVVLLQRQWTGILCNCYLASGEYPEDRCINCFGGKFQINWNQYRNPRRSDGRLMVRFSPAEDVTKQYEAGLESEEDVEIWTLVVPAIHQRDIIVRFDEDDNEEYRYEVMTATRNKTINRLSGGQKLRLKRIRKTDIAYQIPAFRNTQYFPETLTTGITSIPGLAPHSHTVTISENFQNGAAQLTSTSQGHNHAVTLDQQTGQIVVQQILGHTHTIQWAYSNNGLYTFR